MGNKVHSNILLIGCPEINLTKLIGFGQDSRDFNHIFYMPAVSGAIVGPAILEKFCAQNYINTIVIIEHMENAQGYGCIGFENLLKFSRKSGNNDLHERNWVELNVQCCCPYRQGVRLAQMISSLYIDLAVLVADPNNQLTAVMTMKQGKISIINELWWNKAYNCCFADGIPSVDVSAIPLPALSLLKRNQNQKQILRKYHQPVSYTHMLMTTNPRHPLFDPNLHLRQVLDEPLVVYLPPEMLPWGIAQVLTLLDIMEPQAEILLVAKSGEEADDAISILRGEEKFMNSFGVKQIPQVILDNTL
jgi:hypothetical protein